MPPEPDGSAFIPLTRLLSAEPAVSDAAAAAGTSSDNPWLSLLLVFILIFVNGFFAAAEIAVITLNDNKLKKMAEEGRFKEDLLDRLSFEVLFLPPLRERGDDIMLLANHFAAAMATECGKSDVPYFSQEAEEKLMRYPWPGNIRELKNTVERAVCRTRGAEIRDIEFDPFRSPYRPLPGRKSSDPASRPLSDYPHIHDDIDVAFLKRALEEGGGSQKRAAELLGITYDQFRGIYRRLRSCLQS